MSVAVGTHKCVNRLVSSGIYYGRGCAPMSTAQKWSSPSVSSVSVRSVTYHAVGCHLRATHPKRVGVGNHPSSSQRKLAKSAGDSPGDSFILKVKIVAVGVLHFRNSIFAGQGL